MYVYLLGKKKHHGLVHEFADLFGRFKVTNLFFIPVKNGLKFPKVEQL